MRNSFVLYTDQRAVIDKLSNEQAGKLIKAIYEYASTGEMPELDDEILNFVIIPIQQTLNRDFEKYSETVERRRKAGAKGGKQKVANLANATFAKQTLANLPDNDNVNDNDSDSVNVSVNVNDNVRVKKNDPLISKTKKAFIDEYTKIFGVKPFLSFQDSTKLVELSADYPDFEELIPIALARLKNIDFKDINFKPSASWLLKENNFERVMNGEFESKKADDWLNSVLEEKFKDGNNIEFT